MHKFLLLIAIAVAQPPKIQVLAAGTARAVDGAQLRVSIVSISGKVEGGCAGTAQTITGQFAVDVRLPSGRSARTSLNRIMGEGGGLRFPIDAYHDHWTLVFKDYNQDGNPDFALAPWGCHNNSEYFFFTILPSGDVRLLPIYPDNYVFAQAGTFSDGFSLTRYGFRVFAYVNSEGRSAASDYAWNRQLSRFEMVEVDGKPIPPTPAP